MITSQNAYAPRNRLPLCLHTRQDNGNFLFSKRPFYNRTERDGKRRRTNLLRFGSACGPVGNVTRRNERTRPFSKRIRRLSKNRSPSFHSRSADDASFSSLSRRKRFSRESSRGNLFSKKGSLSSSPSKNVFGGRGKKKTHRRLNGSGSSAIGFSKAGESFLKRALSVRFVGLRFPQGRRRFRIAVNSCGVFCRLALFDYKKGVWKKENSRCLDGYGGRAAAYCGGHMHSEM